MNNNLKKALKLMLFMSDQQVLDISKINFKKDKWFQKYTWTAKTEKKFINNLSNMLKKDWEGITNYKPTNKKQRDKVAREFVMNYGCKTRLLNKDDFTDVVSFEQLKEVMSKQELDDFNKWMFGQTTALYGVYRYDLERWLRYKCNPNNEPLYEMD